MEEVEQEGPSGGKRGETDGEEEEVDDGGGEDKAETRKERSNKGRKERDRRWKGHNYSKCLSSI